VANLATKRVDSAAAAANLEAVIRAEIPSAGIKTTVSGSPKQPSFRETFGHELSGYFRSTSPILFWVRAEWSTPRPLEVQVRYVQVGPSAGPLSVLYVTRLRLVVPGQAVLKRTGTWPLTKADFGGDPVVREPLAAAAGFGKAVHNFLQPKVVLGSAIYSIEPFIEVAPDEDGAILAAFNTPARERHGLGGFKLAIRSFLEIAEGIERTLGSVPGARQADRPNAPLPSAAAVAD
jgi:hypothetical protein